jgi:hypothetical protein
VNPDFEYSVIGWTSVVDAKEFQYHIKPGLSVASPIKGIRFWVREDAADVDFRHIDPNQLRSLGQLGGITYIFEQLRKRWRDEYPKSELRTRLQESNRETK